MMRGGLAELALPLLAFVPATTRTSISEAHASAKMDEVNGYCSNGVSLSSDAHRWSTYLDSAHRERRISLNQLTIDVTDISADLFAALRMILLTSSRPYDCPPC